MAFLPLRVNGIDVLIVPAGTALRDITIEQELAYRVILTDAGLVLKNNLGAGFEVLG